MEQSISLQIVREELYTAVVSDALDAIGLTGQCPRVDLKPLTGCLKLVGRAKTTLWAQMWHTDREPYALELAAVDSCLPEEIFVAAAAGSRRSGIWGELLSTAARNRGCVGAIVDGAVRDTVKMAQMKFPVFACGTSPYDSLNRQRVIDMDQPVEVGGVTICPGDLLVADEDGVVVVPKAAEQDVLQRAWKKVQAENVTRDAIRGGMLAVEAYHKFGVL